tara:strand:+ start:609 stop:749 length:141 start_codon:yes stop_codon:yes gene_type:complete
MVLSRIAVLATDYTEAPPEQVCETAIRLKTIILGFLYGFYIKEFIN